MARSRPGTAVGPQGIDRSVLRDRSGKIIGGGDAPEPPGAEELFDWMALRGCQGLEAVQLLAGGGVALRRTADQVAKGQDMVTFPKECWLSAEGDDELSAAEALAWRFLEERWASDASEFAPFVRWLSQKDLSLHPILWDAEEVMWLRASPEGIYNVLLKRNEAGGIVNRLLERCSGAAVPAELAADREALSAQLLWTVALVQEQGLRAEVDGRSAVALCPLVGDLRTAPSLKPGVAVGIPVEDGGRLSLTSPRVPDLGARGWECVSLASARRLRPGQELQKRIMGNTAVVFAKHGIMPGANERGALSDNALMDMNPEATVLFTPDAADLAQGIRGVKGAGLQEKHALAKEFAGIDLSWPIPDDTPIDNIFLRLPNEAVGRGRMLPLARWLALELPEDPQEQRRIFNCVFDHCKFESYPETTSPHKSFAINGDVELLARTIVIGFVNLARCQRQMAMDALAEETGVPVGSAEGVIDVQPGQVVMAHFKAKRSDGKVGKSRKPREAVVMSLEEGAVRVEFTRNRRRHAVDPSWIVELKTAPAAGLLTAGSAPSRLGRAKLAMTLLRVEKAICHLYTDAYEKVKGYVDEILANCAALQQKDDFAGARKFEVMFNDLLEAEKKEVTLEEHFWLPLTVSDMPELRAVYDERGAARMKDSGRMWNLPEVQGFADIPQEEEVVANGKQPQNLLESGDN